MDTRIKFSGSCTPKQISIIFFSGRVVKGDKRRQNEMEWFGYILRYKVLGPCPLRNYVQGEFLCPIAW